MCARAVRQRTPNECTMRSRRRTLTAVSTGDAVAGGSAAMGGTSASLVLLSVVLPARTRTRTRTQTHTHSREKGAQGQGQTQQTRQRYMSVDRRTMQVRRTGIARRRQARGHEARPAPPSLPFCSLSLAMSVELFEAPSPCFQHTHTYGLQHTHTYGLLVPKVRTSREGAHTQRGCAHQERVRGKRGSEGERQTGNNPEDPSSAVCVCVRARASNSRRTWDIAALQGLRGINISGGGHCRGRHWRRRFRLVGFRLLHHEQKLGFRV